MGEFSPKYTICVSGAAETGHCGPGSFEKAKELGAEIVRRDAILIDGATTGFPFSAARGAKEAGGMVVGVSPAATESEHIKSYGLPTDYHDLIFYTGAGYAGRNLLLTRLADAVIVGCGRMGTINEFTIAFEDKKPIGVLEGNWDTDELVKMILEKSHRAEEMKGKTVFSKDPRELVEKLVEIIKIEKQNNHPSPLQDGKMK